MPQAGTPGPQDLESPSYTPSGNRDDDVRSRSTAPIAPRPLPRGTPPPASARVPPGGDNAAHAYFTHLQNKLHHTQNDPLVFNIAEDSMRTSEIRTSHWKDLKVELEVDCLQQDVSFFNRRDYTREQFDDHFAFMTSDAKRHTEVRISQLNASDKRQFDEAKNTELDQWISHSVVRVVSRAGIPIQRIMTMRWVLTWKKDDSGKNKKAKARLVIRGYTDPDLLTLRAEAPTLSKPARHMILQLAASNRWTVEVGDVKTAFLQGDKTEVDRDVYLEPVREIMNRMHMNPKQLLKLEGSAYGLRTAPRTWYMRVRKDMESLGWRCHQLDQCTFMAYEGQELIGIAGVYVDDFVIAGDITNRQWIAAKDKLVKLYNWGKWDKHQFTLCGVQYQQHNDYSISMSMQEYTEKMAAADYDLPKNLSRIDGNTACSASQLKSLRGINGALQWLTTNLRLDLAAQVSISASEISSPKISSLQKANKIIRQAQGHLTMKLTFQSIGLDRLVLGVFTDASWGVRPDGASQGGYMIYAADKDILQGQEALMSILDWKSWKLKRVCRSSLAAETQAFTDAVDQLNWVRLFMIEVLTSSALDLRKTDEILKLCPASHVITDCKSLYDSVERQESAGLGLQEKRTAIELTAIRQVMKETNLSTKWVNSDRQLADILTKPGVDPMTFLHLVRRGRWKIVFDPSFTSARKVKKIKRDEHFKKTDSTIPRGVQKPPKTSSQKQASARIEKGSSDSTRDPGQQKASRKGKGSPGSRQT